MTISELRSLAETVLYVLNHRDAVMAECVKLQEENTKLKEGLDIATAVIAGVAEQGSTESE